MNLGSLIAIALKLLQQLGILVHPEARLLEPRDLVNLLAAGLCICLDSISARAPLSRSKSLPRLDSGVPSTAGMQCFLSIIDKVTQIQGCCDDQRTKTLV
jgi:hypothetical protein